MNFNWENAFMGLLWVFVAFLIASIAVWSFSTERVMGYSLNESSHRISIVKHIDWNPNSTIELDRAITLQECVRMVDSLNASLKKYPVK